MTNGKLKLQTSCAFAHAAQAAERKTASGLLIRVESDCLGLSQRLASDLETAMEIGAGPMAREIMINQVNRAEHEHRPLVCSLTYSS